MNKIPIIPDWNSYIVNTGTRIDVVGIIVVMVSFHHLNDKLNLQHYFEL